MEESAMRDLYDDDIVAWATTQAALLRAGQWHALDIDHLAEEIEAVARAEVRELGSRTAVFLAHLLKWQYQPGRRSTSWLRTIGNQRRRIGRLVQKTPSLKPLLADAEWLDEVWEDAVEIASRETGLDEFPQQSPWQLSEVFESDFLPEL